MVAKYDIFKKINESILWVEDVEDIVTLKKRLISLASNGTDGYRIWDSTKEQFIDLLDDSVGSSGLRTLLLTSIPV
jgi:hypothetical protein